MVPECDRFFAQLFVSCSAVDRWGHRNKAKYDYTNKL